MRAWTGLLIVVLAFIGGIGVSPVASADPVAGEEGKYIHLQWEGPTTTLNWEGTTYTTADASVVGSAVAVPGDRVERTVIVRNDGPADAIATVQIVSVSTVNHPLTKGTDLEDLIHLFWDIDGQPGDEVWREMRLRSDDAGVSHTVSFSLPRGDEFTVRAGYYFPLEATGGMSQGYPSAVLSFDVRVILQGDTAPVSVPTGGHRVSGSLTGVSIGILGLGLFSLAACHQMQRRGLGAR